LVGGAVEVVGSLEGLFFFCFWQGFRDLGREFFSLAWWWGDIGGIELDGVFCSSCSFND